jgi:hypothetical protein
MKRISLFMFMFFGLFGNLFFATCQVQGQDTALPGPPFFGQPRWQAGEEQVFQWVSEGKEYSMFAPEHLCPFTVEVYPEVLYWGDPLYVRMKFRNNTDKDAYAFASPFESRHILFFVLGFYFKCPNETIPWSVSSGRMVGSPGFLIWQKVKPGETGLTQHMVLSVPGTRTPLSFFYVPTARAREQWDEKIRSGDTTGQLVVVIRGSGRVAPGMQGQTIESVSPRITIRPREQEEVTLLEATNLRDRNGLEQVIPKLTPGTLQNFLKYQLLLLELREGIRGEPKISGAQVLEHLEKIDSFLKPLHEIERESLKRHADSFLAGGAGRQWIERNMRNYSDKHLERFIEVFGETPAPVILPFDFRGIIGSLSE